MSTTGRHDYYAYAVGQGRGHGHRITAANLEAAAVGYTEHYAPPIDDEGDVRIVVRDVEHGDEHCFRIDLSDGRARACD